MATVILNFARAFMLNLGRDPNTNLLIPPIRIEKGLQPIDEQLATHFYVRANLVNAEMRQAVPGQMEFLQEDAAQGAALRARLDEAQAAAAALEGLRQRKREFDARGIMAEAREPNPHFPARPLNERTADAIREQEEAAAVAEKAPPAKRPSVRGAKVPDASNTSSPDASEDAGKADAPAEGEEGSATVSGASGRARL